jgi:hypothetical protein
MGKQNPEFYVQLHCINHQQSLCGRTMKCERVMKVVISAVNFIRSHGLNHRQFQSFVSETDAAYGDVLYHAEA